MRKHVFILFFKEFVTKNARQPITLKRDGCVVEMGISRAGRVQCRRIICEVGSGVYPYLLINNELNIMMSRMQCESMSSPNMMLAINDPRRPNVAEAAAAITLLKTHNCNFIIVVLVSTRRAPTSADGR